MAAALSDRLKETFARGVNAPLPDEEFDELARAVFGHQFAGCSTYRSFCEGRGVTPERLGSWTEIPPVPTSAFKSLSLVTGDPDCAQAVFRTSGTSQGIGARGFHFVLDLSLYRASLIPNFLGNVLPGGGSMPVLSLIPSFQQLPDSSLSWMVQEVQSEISDPRSGHFMDVVTGLREEAFDQVLRDSERSGEPVLIMSTAFALVHWLESVGETSSRYLLPEGSRVMETGGFKGRSRTVPRPELYRAVSETLGVPVGMIVNEYGMTEMLSQFYEPVLRVDGAAGETSLADRCHKPPPWVRTRVLDPVDLEPVDPGEIGILAHFDLANLNSISAILTADTGRSVEEGFVLFGRTSGSEPRGCSLTAEELMTVSREWIS